MGKINNLIIKINPVLLGGGTILLCYLGITLSWIGLTAQHKIANDILFHTCTNLIFFIIIPISFLLNLLSMILGILNFSKKGRRLKGILGIFSGIIGFIFLLNLIGLFFILMLADPNP